MAADEALLAVLEVFKPMVLVGRTTATWVTTCAGMDVVIKKPEMAVVMTEPGTDVVTKEPEIEVVMSDPGKVVTTSDPEMRVVMTFGGIDVVSR